MEIFKRVPKNTEKNLISNRFVGKNFIQNSNTQKHSFRQICCISFESFEKNSDCNSAVLETLVSLLELDPFHLVNIEGVHLDRVTGKFRQSQKAIESLALKDPVLEAILSCSTVSNSSSNSHCNDSEDDEFDDLFGAVKGRSIQSGNELAFECSRLSLATHLGIQVNDVSGRLFALQEKGILQYSLSDSAIYLTINTQYNESATSIDCVIDQVDDDGAYFTWLWKQSQLLYDIVDRIDSTALRRVESMWKIGSTMAHFTRDAFQLDNNPTRTYSSSSLPYSTSADSAIKNPPNNDALQYDLQTFLAHVMEDNLQNINISARTPYLPDMIHQYEITKEPFKNILFNENCAGDIDQKQREKYVDGLRLSVAAIRQDPMLLHAIETILKCVQPFLIFIESSHSNDNHVEDSLYPTDKDLREELCSLYVARVLHGLSSKLLTAAVWKDGFLADCWGKYKDVSFGDIQKLLSTL